MGIIKRVVLLAGLLLCTAAMAQEVNVTGKDFESGAGDAPLAKIAQQAASEGKALSVTAPPYWQAKVEAKLHAGAANVKVFMSSGFFENVLVRVVDHKPAMQENKPRQVDRERTEKAAAEERAKQQREAAARAAAAKVAATRRAQADRIAAQKLAAEKAKADAQAAATARAEKEAAAKAAAQKAAMEKAAAAKAAAAKAEADRIARIRQGMLNNLNSGRSADGTLSVSQLQRNDQLYVDGPERGVVRRASGQIRFYWLQGQLNLERIELMPNGQGRYSVLRPIDETGKPVLRTRAGGHLLAKVPASNSAERRSLEQSYGQGRDITDTLQPSGLRSGDMVYTGKSAAVVVRRSSRELQRFWLVGDLNLGQVGLIKQGGNTYRVLSDTVK